MSKNIQGQRTFILIFICLIVVCCQAQSPFIIVPIREAEFREEHSLPLDSTRIEEIVEFIADGGVHRDNGVQASLEHEIYRRFLQFFTKEENLTWNTFRMLSDLREFIDPEAPVRDVIDAREKEAPKGINRLAYRYRDFWFVFMVDELFIDGRPIKDSERRFARLIVMQVLDRKEKTK